MATSFADLKKNSKNSVSDLQKNLEASQKKSFKKDERYWVPTKDDNGNALAIIRFLPAPQGEDLPYVTYFDHSFKVENRYYINRSRTSLGKDERDPVAESNKALWDSGDEMKKDLARERKRKLHYVSNILVIKDTGNPENNGKVFLYDYGMKIFGKIKDQAQPDLEEDTPYDIFNLFEGKNFRLKIKKQGEFPNYDDSAFQDVSALAGGDEEKMEEIWNKCYSLEAEIAADKFLPYEELKKKLDYVLYGNSSSKSAEEKINEDLGSNEDLEIDLIDKNISKEKTSKKSKVDEDEDFTLDMSDFKLDDDIPF
jgi:hypothetical protein